MDAILFNQEESIMKLFIDNAKTYIQLSTGALVLSITFIKEVINSNQKPVMLKDSLLILSWLMYLIAIGFGSYYQYLAVKHLEFMSENSGTKIPLPELLTDPGTIYFIMMVAFYLGAILFTATAIRRMWMGGRIKE
jgi:hypothetical protein